MNAIQDGHFEQTLIAYHPGVSTMWVGGLRQFFVGNSAVWGSLRDLALARWFICVVVSTGIIAIFFLLRRLFGVWKLATAAWGFVVVDPFLLAQTRRVHTDALATIFILLTVLLFLIFCVTPTKTQRQQKYCYLVFAGIAFGLACLSKSYVLILLPWLPFCLWLFCSSNTPWGEFVSHSLTMGVCFLSWSLLTVFFLWPLFWHPLGGIFGFCLLGSTFFLQHFVQTGKLVNRYIIGIAALVLIACTGYAIKTFWFVLEKVGWALTTVHEVDHFFLGQIVADPGWRFYLFTLSIKSTPFVLPLAIVGIMFLWGRKQHPHFSRLFKISIAIGVFTVLFTVCLSLTSKKFSRYLLPVFPMLDLLAGIGLFYTVKWIGARFLNHHFRKMAQVACVTLVLLLTAVPVFVLHPYYGTYYNLCWKVIDLTQIITVGEASGLDLAAKYLAEKPNSQNISVQASDLSSEFLRYYFNGIVYRSDKNRISSTNELRSADYEVVYIRDLQIGRVPKEGTRGGILERTITLNGIDLVWIYRIPQKEESL